MRFKIHFEYGQLRDTWFEMMESENIEPEINDGVVDEVFTNHEMFYINSFSFIEHVLHTYCLTLNRIHEWTTGSALKDYSMFVTVFKQTVLKFIISRLRKHPHYQFSDQTSRFWIIAELIDMSQSMKSSVLPFVQYHDPLFCYSVYSILLRQLVDEMKNTI